MSNLQNNLAFLSSIQELSFDEIDIVSGGIIDFEGDDFEPAPWMLGRDVSGNGSSGPSWSDYISAIVGAVCGEKAKNKLQAALCAVGSVALSDVLSSDELKKVGAELQKMKAGGAPASIIGL